MRRKFTKYPSGYVRASLDGKYQYDVEDMQGNITNVRANSHKEAVEKVAGCPVIRATANDADYKVYYGGGYSDRYALYSGGYARTYYYKCV
jgi:hypothetical protein